MRFVEKDVLELDRRFADQKVKQAFWGEYENEVVIAFEHDVTGGTDDSVVAAFKVFAKVSDQFRARLVNQRF